MTVLDTTGFLRFTSARSDRNHKLLDATVTLPGSTIRRDPAPARLVGVIRVDVFSSEKRSEIMRRIRSRDTKWEINFRRRLWMRGLRYRTNYGPFKVDIAFPQRHLAVFLDSCFWHFCPDHGEIPVANRDFWLQKFERTPSRDKIVDRRLEEAGWHVMRFWSHDFVHDPDPSVTRVVNWISRHAPGDRGAKHARREFRQKPAVSLRRQSGERIHRKS